MNSISKKKQSYKVSEPLKEYLHQYNRLVKIPFSYTELLRFFSSLPNKDKHGKDTLL